MICHVIDHLGLQATDVDAAAAAYLRLLAPLGIHEAMRFPGPVVGMAGPNGMPDFWLSPAPGPTNHEAHVAFTAPDRAAVDAVYAAALEAGLEILHAPREFPEYPPPYFATFWRDPHGFLLEAVCHYDRD